MRGTIVPVPLKNGKTHYRTIIWVAGRQRWRTFGKRKEAEGYLDSLSQDVRDHTYREIKPATFTQYIEHWLETHIRPDLKPSTISAYRCMIAVHLQPFFGRLPMQSITSADINRFQASLMKSGRSVKTARNVMILLKKIFQDAKADQYIRHSEFDGVKLPSTDKIRKGRALQPEEIALLLEKCDGKARPIVMTAVLAGLRRGEILGLRWKDVDFKEDVIRVRQSLYWRYGKYSGKFIEGEPRYEFILPKSKYSIRDVDLSSALKKELLSRFLAAGRPSEEELVFQSEEGTPVDPDGFIDRHFLPAVKAANLGHFRFHDLRHSFGSLKIEQGEDLVYVQRQMGHSSISVTVDLYAHLLRKRRPEATARTDELIFGSK